MDLSKLSDAELLARASGQQPPADVSKMTDAELLAKTPTLLDRAKGAYKAIDTGVAEGAAGLMSLPRSMAEWGQSLQEIFRNELGLKKPPNEQPPLAMNWPSHQDVRGQINKQFYGDQPGTVFPIEPDYQPQNPLEKGLKTGGEFSLGAAAPGGWFARLARVVAPTVTSETAGHLTEGTPYEGMARTAGALVGGGVQGGAEAVLSRPRTAEQILSRQLPQSTTPQMVNEAEALMRDANAAGIRLTWPEALSQVQQRPVLSDTMRHVEASSASGPRMAEFYADRPQRVQGAVEGQAQAISPGAPTDPYTIGPAVGRAASETLDLERQAINARSDPYYAASAIQPVPPAEMAYVQSLPGWADAAAAVRNNSQLARNVAGLPEDSVAFLNAVKKEMGRQSENATSAFRERGRDVTEASGWSMDEAGVRNAALRASRAATPPGIIPPYQEALRIETEGRARILQPLLEGPLGDLAKHDIKTKEALGVLFPRDPLAHSARQIGNAVSDIAARSPKLAEDAVRSHIETAFNTAGRDLQTGPNQAGGAKFRAFVAGSGQQRANLQAAIEALPNGAERWQGFSRLLDVLEATGTRLNPGSRTAYNVEALKEFGPSASGLVKDIAQVAANPVSGMKPFTDRYQGWKIGQNLDDVARILTDRRSGNLLRQIAASPRGGMREANVVRALFASQAMQPAISATGKEANR